MTRFFCSAASHARGEPLFATASTVNRWLLVEQAGPWGPESFPTSRLAPPLVHALQAQARAGGARLLLLRRPGGLVSRWRHVIAVDSRPSSEQVWVRTLADDASLTALDVPWEAPDPAPALTTTAALNRPDADGPLPWTSATGPLLAVCTHGRHDACCAVQGRPIAARLAAAHPAVTWECSHIGGDRFAANALVLPQGVYLGRLAVDTAVAVVDDVLAGRLPEGFTRGRSALSLPAQAAQHFAAQRCGGRALPPVATRQLDANRWQVVLRDGDESVAVTVGRHFTEQTWTLTCRAPSEHCYPQFELVAWEPAGAD